MLGHNSNTPSRPTYSFLGDNDTGLYSAGANSVALSANGTRRVNVIGGSSVVDIDPVGDGSTVFRFGNSFQPVAGTPTLGVSANPFGGLFVSNCADGAGDAECGAAPSGSFVLDAADADTAVSTTAVTADSQILIQKDASLGTRLGVTCNTTFGRTYMVTARTAGTSFTVTASGAPATNPACLNYFIVN